MSVAAPIEEAFNEPAHGTTDRYRYEIGQLMRVISTYSRLGAEYADLGNDAALRYNLRCLIAYVKTARDIAVDLKKNTDAEAVQ